MQGGGTETGVLLLVVFVLFLSGQQTLPLQPRPGNTQDKKIFDKEGGFGTLVCASFCVLLLMGIHYNGVIFRTVACGIHPDVQNPYCTSTYACIFASDKNRQLNVSDH